MNFIKKMTFSTYLLIASGLLALVALIVGAVSCAGEGFGMDEMPAVITFTIFALALTAATVFIAVRYGESPWVTALVIAVVLFVSLSMYFMLVGKTDVMGTVMFSDLEKGYKPAEDACYIGLASIIIYIISAFAGAVSTFFRLAKPV